MSSRLANVAIDMKGLKETISTPRRKSYLSFMFEIMNQARDSFGIAGL